MLPNSGQTTNFSRYDLEFDCNVNHKIVQDKILEKIISDKAIINDISEEYGFDITASYKLETKSEFNKINQFLQNSSFTNITSFEDLLSSHSFSDASNIIDDKLQISRFQKIENNVTEIDGVPINKLVFNSSLSSSILSEKELKSLDFVNNHYYDEESVLIDRADTMSEIELENVNQECRNEKDKNGIESIVEKKSQNNIAPNLENINKNYLEHIFHTKNIHNDTEWLDKNLFNIPIIHQQQENNINSSDSNKTMYETNKTFKQEKTYQSSNSFESKMNNETQRFFHKKRKEDGFKIRDDLIKFEIIKNKKKQTIENTSIDTKRKEVLSNYDYSRCYVQLMELKLNSIIQETDEILKNLLFSDTLQESFETMSMQNLNENNNLFIYYNDIKNLYNKLYLYIRIFKEKIKCLEKKIAGLEKNKPRINKMRFQANKFSKNLLLHEDKFQKFEDNSLEFKLSSKTYRNETFNPDEKTSALFDKYNYKKQSMPSDNKKKCIELRKNLIGQFL